MDKATITFWITISFLFYALTILAIIDVIRKDFGTIGKKALWGIISLIPFIGWLVYLVVRPHERLDDSQERDLEIRAKKVSLARNGLVCPACMKPVEIEFLICPYCLKKLKKPCSECDHALRLNWTICPYCQTAQ